MRRALALPLIVVAATLAACGSSAGTASAPASSAAAPASPAAAPTSSAAAPASSAAAPAPSPLDTASLTCDDFDKAAPTVVSALHALAAYLSSGNDAGPNLGELASGMAVLNAMAPQCAPKAVDALAAMSAAADTVATVYDSGSDPAVIAADKQALDAVKPKGVAAWKAMGLDVAPWDLALHYYF